MGVMKWCAAWDIIVCQAVRPDRIPPAGWQADAANSI